MILAKDLVESVMQRIGVSDYTILGTVKGAELELLRFTHPFMDFDVPAILGDHVTLDVAQASTPEVNGGISINGGNSYAARETWFLEVTENSRRARREF